MDDSEALYRRAESSLGVGAAIVGQGAALLHPAVESGMNISVNVLEMRRELIPPEQLPAHECEHGALLCLVSSYTFEHQVQPESVEGAWIGELWAGVIAG